MKKVEFLYLSQEQIIDLGLKMQDVIQTVEQCLAEHGKGAVENPPKPGVHPLENAFIHAMPGFIPAMKVCGMKWVAGFPTNQRYNLPTITGVLVLNDVETGIPLAIMDCRWITAQRTAAVTAVTARYCARKDSESVGLVGAGVQGRFNVMAICEILPNLKEVKVFDVSRESLTSFVELIAQKTDLVCRIVESPREAVVGCDVVITATGNVREPMVKYEWLKEGVFAAAIEATRAWEGEVVHKVDLFVNDDWEQTKYYAAHGFYPAGLPREHTEIGQIIIKRKAGRENPRQKILAINCGLAIEDMAVGKRIYEMALEKKIGQWLPLMSTDRLI